MHSEDLGSKSLVSDLVALILSYLEPQYQIQSKCQRGREERRLTITVDELEVELRYYFYLRLGTLDRCPLRSFLTDVDNRVESKLYLRADGAYIVLYWYNDIIRLPSQAVSVKGKMAQQIIAWLRQIEASREPGQIFSVYGG